MPEVMRETISDNAADVLKPALAAQTRWREQAPITVMTWLPLTLFFPVGWMYAGIALFVLSLIGSGNFQEKINRVRHHPLCIPVGMLSLMSILVGLLQPRSTGEFWPAFWHYQSYLFLFVFLMLGNGAWQQRATKVFFFGAFIAASCYYLAALGALPAIGLFRSYLVYEGNKSILIGILLALAASWMLYEWRLRKNYSAIRLIAFLYVVLALFLCAKSRTASLLFLLLTTVVFFHRRRFRQWHIVTALLGVVGAVSLIINVMQLPSPPTCLAKKMRDTYQMSGMEIALNRAICTVHQVRDFGQGKQVSEDGMRLELYQNTWEMIKERPWFGHGIGQWVVMYPQKAQGTISAKMTTPHNDYLLYWFELGFAGVSALFAIWMMQLWLVRKMNVAESAEQATVLLMMTVTMMFVGFFNAVLRDGVFAFAMLILLAIPMVSFKNKT